MSNYRMSLDELKKLSGWEHLKDVGADLPVGFDTVLHEALKKDKEHMKAFELGLNITALNMESGMVVVGDTGEFHINILRDIPGNSYHRLPVRTPLDIERNADEEGESCHECAIREAEAYIAEIGAIREELQKII